MWASLAGQGGRVEVEQNLFNRKMKTLLWCWLDWEEEDSFKVEIVASREDKMNVYQDRTLWLGRGWGP